MATTMTRPGNMETIYEKRTDTTKFGTIVEYQDKFKTLMIKLSDGTYDTMSWSTFRGVWRIKQNIEPVIEEADLEQTFETTPEEETTEVSTYKQPSTKGNKGIMFTIDNEDHTISEWAKIYDIDPSLVYCRVYRTGWDIEKALTTPPRKRGSK